MSRTSFTSLMYHGIHSTPECDGCFDAVYSVTRESFVEQLDYLQANHYQAVTLEQALSGDYQKPVVITFDDGDVSNYSFAFPELKKRNMLAEFYITSDWIDTRGYMSKAQLLEMHQAGMSIQAHGQTHSYMSDLPTDELEQELKISKQTVEEITQSRVHTVALPGGRGLKQVLPLYKRLGYSYIATSVLGHNKRLQPIRRITMTSNTNIEVLANMLSGTGFMYRKAIFTQQVLTLAKRLLGNKNYEKIRSKLIRV
ncbi:polysaccharide deacetylase family protein [Thalassomonas viridans]|uniref:Polysaccharide deacetylase family protein n=1 Tax=Thalassomonas viridans TaxID=137584 RepID=A0AAE9Z2U6_9GAMM|nr:polysaccharide deacetylase family protein [Thalassomonas viridans]WDE05014.1 polysaccharide deacetylase family protein [Thalassomonas viridans]